MSETTEQQAPTHRPRWFDALEHADPGRQLWRLWREGRQPRVDLAKASAANPNDTLLALKVSALQAWFGQEKELAATRQRIVAFAKDTDEAGTAKHAAKACSIRASTDKAELDAVLALARKGVELQTNSEWREWRLLALGMAEYRSGHDAAAVEALQGALKAGPNNPKRRELQRSTGRSAGIGKESTTRPGDLRSSPRRR